MSSLPQLNASVVPCGGIVVLNYYNDPESPPVGPWALTRVASGSTDPAVTLYAGAPVVLTIDSGYPTNIPLNPATTYVYTLTDPSGSVSVSVQPASTVTIQTDDLTTLLIRMLQAGIAGITLPDPAWIRPKILHAMPLTGRPALPIITLADQLLQQQFVPLGENVNTDYTLNQYYINDIIMRHYRITILTTTVLERQFYRDTVIGLFKSVMGPLLEQIGQNVTHRYQAASSQVVGEVNNPGFYFCDINLELTGVFNILVTTNYGVIAIIDPEITALTDSLVIIPFGNL
jgi:hypothetical protein